VLDDQISALPGLTACSLCAGETLGSANPLAGGQLERLRGLLSAGLARLTAVECLDECERGDVVVARPSSRYRAAGAAPVWFERLAGPAVTAELGEWLQAGGPGACALPTSLEELVIRRPVDASSDSNGVAS
jgi:(2Fe-2S) ferredoxin